MKLKVLAVDDSPSIVHLLKDILSHHGCRVEVAKDGQTALQKYEELKPDIVTLDLGLPGMNGYEVLSKILEKDPNAKVIIITANPFTTLEECLKSGAVALLEKPFRRQELLGTIEQALAGRRVVS